ncbi:MAG TPA: kynureninase, partial [Chitinophagales bacterium]
MQFENTLRFAKQLDKNDSLASFRNEYFIPKHKGKETIYLCGNSLGLQPKCTQKFIQQELDDWKTYGVEGHFHAKNPWLSYHKQFEKPLCDLLGAKKNEVVAMNQLTVNLNLLLISFYQPKGKKKKILLEANAFPSDFYAVEQIIKLRKEDPKKCLLELPLRKNEYTHRTEDIIDFIRKNKEELALILLGAVNYYSGQFFDAKAISDEAKKHGIIFGLDLAHAIGNLPLELHKWNVDFATWCSYKYLNSGAGGVSGIFVNDKYAKRFDLDRLAGWWGNDEKTRFKMLRHFEPDEGAQGWQISNAPVLSMAAHAAALSLFEKAGIKNLRKKSIELTNYLHFLLSQLPQEKFAIITPQKDNARGAQLSIQTKNSETGRKIFKQLSENGVIADWREPDVIRIAPVPMYNSFE